MNLFGTDLLIIKLIDPNYFETIFKTYLNISSYCLYVFKSESSIDWDIIIFFFYSYSIGQIIYSNTIEYKTVYIIPYKYF